MSRTCLILSYGPIPTPEHKKVEGGGLRCWGLAKGLLENNPNLQITVAYNDSYKINIEHTESYEGIRIDTWNSNSVKQLIHSYDTILVSYCMGDLSNNVVEHIRPDQQLVLDCYVPIYVEVSARDSADKEQEYYAFMGDVERWKTVLQRGDLFLCASEPQKKYYEGVLSGVGRLNPVTYGDDVILVTPYGIYDNEPKATEKPISKRIGKSAKSFKKILWFGGIYPWFDLRDLVDAVNIINKSIPTKLVIVGAKNPFNNHPDFTARYDQLMEHVSKVGSDVVIMQDWVDFNTRGDWYLDSDIVVVINKEGQENSLAWRTRLVDFVWADLPIATNGGDPLGEKLIVNNAARRLDVSSKKTLATGLTDLLSDDSRMKKLRRGIKTVREELLWRNATASLSGAVKEGKRSKDLTDVGVSSFVAGNPAYGNNKLARVMRKARKVPAYTRKHGYRMTATVVTGKIKDKLGIDSSGAKVPSMTFISHQLDMSGAPFVLMDMAKEYAQQQDAMPVNFVTYLPVHNENIRILNKNGIKPTILADKDRTPTIARDSIVVLNTVAHSEPVKDDLFTKAESGFLRKLIWYVHEDEPELIFRPDERIRIKSLLDSGRLEFFTAAEKTKFNYEKYFGTDKVRRVIYRHIVDKKYHATLHAKNFSDKLIFSLPGTVGDGRKGQLPVFYAFSEFYHRYYKHKPSVYRDFELVYIGLIDDFLSRQLILHSKGLGDRFTHYGKLTHEQCMEVTSKANVTICYSMRECLPLFVYEGMISGHPILRNDSSGQAEQLEEGKNGFALKSDDYEGMVDTIETILNKKKTSDITLADMSKRSYEIAVACENNSYLPSLNAATEEL